METFAGSMRYWSSGEDFLTSHVVNGFDWASLPKDAVVVDVSLLSDPLSICTEDEKLIYSQWSYIPGKAHYLALGWWKRWSHKHCNCSGKSKPTSSRSRSSWSNSAKLNRSQRESFISRVVRPSRLQICWLLCPATLLDGCRICWRLLHVLHTPWLEWWILHQNPQESTAEWQVEGRRIDRACGERHSTSRK